jgi:signal transduction histidine kinase
MLTAPTVNVNTSPLQPVTAMEQVVEEPVSLLLVDDDARNLDVLESILSSPDYRLVRAGTAEDALLALMTGEFAVIVLDIRMPGMNGLELAQIIKQRKKTKDIPIIFLTAYYQENEHVMHGYDAGGVDYLTKPCNPVVLRSKVGVFVNLFRKTRALHAEITERRRLETEIAHAIEREQLRLGQELHDGLGQQLTGISYMIQALQKRMGKASPAVVREVNRLQTLIQQSVEQSRNLAKLFYPVELERLGLLTALQEIWHKTALFSNTSYVVESDDDPSYAGLKGQPAIQLFRIAQESVHNALKHGGAKRISVRLETADDIVTLTVRDDGSGLAPDLDKGKGMGLHIMQYRARMIGGKLDVRNARGGGVIVTCSVPKQLFTVHSSVPAMTVSPATVCK